MKKAVLLIAIATFPFHNSAAAERVPVHVFGAGYYSCAAWLQDAAHLRDGQSWVLGYWSGLNAHTPGGGVVGSNTDGPAILEEVRRICEREPSTDLIDATNRQYERTIVRERTAPQPRR